VTDFNFPTRTRGPSLLGTLAKCLLLYYRGPNRRGHAAEAVETQSETLLRLGTKQDPRRQYEGSGNVLRFARHIRSPVVSWLAAILHLQQSPILPLRRRQRRSRGV
jgi:hypothetical protein